MSSFDVQGEPEDGGPDTKVRLFRIRLEYTKVALRDKAFLKVVSFRFVIHLVDICFHKDQE